MYWRCLSKSGIDRWYFWSTRNSRITNGQQPWGVSKSSRIYWIANNSFRSSGYLSLVSSANTCANLFVIVDENCFTYFSLRFFFFFTLFFCVFFPGNIQTWKYTEIAVGNVFPFPSSVNIFLFRERNFRSRAFRFFVGLVITRKKFAFLLIFLSPSAASLRKENEMIRRQGKNFYCISFATFPREYNSSKTRLVTTIAWRSCNANRHRAIKLRDR